MIDYKTTDNWISTIYWNISASSTTITCKAWEWALFPSEFPFLLTLEKYSWGIVIKREIVKVTDRVWDVFTVERKFLACVQDDTAEPKVKTQNSFTFDDGDSITLSIYSENDEQIKWELTRLENQKITTPTITDLTANHTFTWTETNNTQFNVDTTSWDITLDLDLSLFSSTNWLYQFTIVKESWDTNKVILDLWTATIDWNTTYQLSAENQSVTFVIESDTKAKVVSTSNAPATTDIEWQTQVNSINLSDKLIISRQWEWNKSIEYWDILNTEKEKFTAWEDLLAWDCVYIKNSDWKAYKTNADIAESATWYLWFATTDTLQDNEVIIDFLYTKSLTWLTIGSKYYIAWSELSIYNTTWTFDSNYKLWDWPWANNSVSTNVNLMSQSFTINTDILKNITLYFWRDTSSDILNSVRLWIANSYDWTPFAYSNTLTSISTTKDSPRTFTFSDIPLTNWQKYWIRIELDMEWVFDQIAVMTASNNYWWGELYFFRSYNSIGWYNSNRDLKFIINQWNYIDSWTIATTWTTEVWKAYKTDMLLISNNTQ